MTKWRYGDAGDRYPVQRGDLWRVGPHRLLCADLEDDASAIRGFVETEPIDLVYSDPPWDAGHARSFRTKSGVDGAAGRRVDFEAFLTRLIRTVVIATPKIALIEMGIKQTPLLDRLLQEAGFVDRHEYETTYRKHPARLLSGSLSGRYGRLAIENGLDDEDTPEAALRAAEQLFPVKVIFDPCMGRGLTAVTAARMGKVAVGVELAPRRLAVAIDKLSKMTGITPERVDHA